MSAHFKTLVALLCALASMIALPAAAQSDFSGLYHPEIRDLRMVADSRLGTGRDVNCPPKTLRGKYMIHVDGKCMGDIRTGRSFYDEWKVRRSSTAFGRTSQAYSTDLATEFGTNAVLARLGNEAWVLDQHERIAKEFNGWRAERSLETTLQVQFMMNWYIANGYPYSPNVDLYKGFNKSASTGTTMSRNASEPHIAIRVHLGFAITHANGDRFPWNEQEVEDILNRAILANVTQFLLWEKISASGNPQARTTFSEMARQTGLKVYGIDLTKYELDGFGGLNLK